MNSGRLTTPLLREAKGGSPPRAEDVARRLRSLDLLAAADTFLSETAALADIVLPVTQWAEEEGAMTTLEGRVILRRRAKAPPKPAPIAAMLH